MLPTDHGSRMQRALQSLEGLSAGDAFGEQFFVAPELLPERLAARALPAAPWRWTDDTAMALSVCEVLATHGRIEQDALAAAFARRYRDQPARGYGAAAHQILDALANGVAWTIVTRAQFDGEGSLGNGAAMRAAPIGGYFAGDPARAAAEARASAEPTHWHPDGQAGAIAVAVAAAVAAVHGDAGALFDAALAATPAGDTRTGVEAAAAIPFTEEPAAVAERLGSGFRVVAADTVPFALWCAARHLGDFVGAMWSTVSGLGDRDTTCAIVGGIVALGAAIPPEWLAAREPLPPLDQ